jgi:hypothetical protein
MVRTRCGRYKRFDGRMVGRGREGETHRTGTDVQVGMRQKVGVIKRNRKREDGTESGAERWRDGNRSWKDGKNVKGLL